MSTADRYQVPKGQRQLFIDDHGVGAVESLTRALHQPSKKGAVIRPDVTRGEKGMQTRSVPHWDPRAELFRLLADSTWFESADGLHWRRCKQQCEAGAGTPAYHVLFDEAEPDPERRYKGLTMHTMNEKTGLPVKDNSEIVDPEGKPWPGRKIQMFLDFRVSGDGVRWRQLDCSLPSSDEQNLSYDPLGSQYIVSLKRRGTYGRSHAISTSPDFETWSEPELAIQTDDLDQELGRLHIEDFLQTANADYLKPFPNTPAWHWQNIDIYNVGVFRYEGIFLALPAIYHARGQRWSSHTLRFTLIQLWCSRDLHRWDRVAERKPFIPWSPVDSGAYDLNKNLPPSCPLVRDEELWFYYSGRKEYSVFPDPDPDIAAVCLAVLRRDGFVSMDAGAEQGTLLTKPFVLPEGQLWANVNAQRGQLRVEVLDSADEVIATSAAIEADHRRISVPWNDGDPSAATDKPVKLRFSLRDASLFSFWIE